MNMMSSKLGSPIRSRKNDRVTGMASPQSVARPSAHYDVFVSPLPPSITEAQLRSHFGARSNGAAIKEVDIVRKSPDVKFVYGFVRYSTLAEAKRSVCAMNGSEFLGNRIRVDLSYDSKQRGTSRGQGLLSRAFPENPPVGQRGHPVSPSCSDTSLKDIFCSSNRSLSRALLSKPDITADVLSSFPGMKVPCDGVQISSESDLFSIYPPSEINDTVTVLLENVKDSGYQSHVTTAGYSSSTSSPIQSIAHSPADQNMLNHWYDPTYETGSTDVKGNTETVKNPACSLDEGDTIADVSFDQPPPLVGTESDDEKVEATPQVVPVSVGGERGWVTDDADKSGGVFHHTAPRRVGRGRGAVLVHLLDQIGDGFLSQQRRVDSSQECKPLHAVGRGRAMKELLAKLSSQVPSSTAVERCDNDTSSRGVAVDATPAESHALPPPLVECTPSASVRTRRNIKLAASFIDPAKSQSTAARFEHARKSPPLPKENQIVSSPLQPSMPTLSENVSDVEGTISPPLPSCTTSVVQSQVLADSAPPHSTYENIDSKTEDSSCPPLSCDRLGGSSAELEVNEVSFPDNFLPLLAGSPPPPPPTVGASQEYTDEERGSSHSLHSPPPPQSRRSTSLPINADTSPLHKHPQALADGLSRHSQNPISPAETRGCGFFRLFTPFEEQASPPIDRVKHCASPTQHDPPSLTASDEGASPEGRALSSDEDDDSRFAKTRKGRTSNQMEKRIALMQRNIHRWQVELKRTLHKNEVMKVQVVEELKEVDIENVSRLTPEKYQEFYRLIDLQANFVMESALLEMNVKLREEISGKGQQHYAGDKLALLELQLELEEAKLRDDLQRAKLENKALNAKLEYFL